MSISTQTEKWFSWSTLHQRIYYIFKHKCNALPLIYRCSKESIQKRTKEIRSILELQNVCCLEMEPLGESLTTTIQISAVLSLRNE